LSIPSSFQTIFRGQTYCQGGHWTWFANRTSYENSFWLFDFTKQTGFCIHIDAVGNNQNGYLEILHHLKENRISVKDIKDIVDIKKR
jgi:hypothetical protein